MINIGEKINNRFRLTSRIAQGGMAEVYEAIDLNSKKTCAVKFILEDLIKNQENLIRFNHEARIVSRLRHPGIVSIVESGIYLNRPYIAFEFVKGQTVGERLKLGSKFTIIEACEIALQVCEVLSYIHSKGIIHRDIKPDNIYYSFDGIVKLSDFGVALDLTNKTKEDEALVGSVHYLAPEACESGEVTYSCDIYALGITFFEIITNTLPFMKEDPLDVAVMQIKDEMPKPSLFVPDLPKAIENVILKATMKNPNERYHSARDMALDLKEILENKEKYLKKRTLFQKFFGLGK